MSAAAERRGPAGNRGTGSSAGIFSHCLVWEESRDEGAVVNRRRDVFLAIDRWSDRRNHTDGVMR
jgi:hypothetical protein